MAGCNLDLTVQTFLEMLFLIMSDQRSEERLLLRAQGLWHSFESYRVLCWGSGKEWTRSCVGRLVQELSGGRDGGALEEYRGIYGANVCSRRSLRADKYCRRGSEMLLRDLQAVDVGRRGSGGGTFWDGW